jgi:hypothetical protein
MPLAIAVFNSDGSCRRTNNSRFDWESQGAAMTSRRIQKLQFDAPYDALLEGILSFKTLAEAERTLEHLEDLRQRFCAESDKKGVEYCRQIGVLGRRRAELIARNRRVTPSKRLVKQEVALWFRIWLETPELFADWLSLRKRTQEFQRLRELESGC